MNRLFRFFLRLYPKAYEDQFGREMEAVFEEAAADRRREGSGVFLFFAAGEMIGLAIGAAAEWSARFTARDYMAGTAPAAEPPVPLDEVAAAEMRLDAILGRMVWAIANHQFETARNCSYQERVERENLRVLRARYGQ